MKANDIFIGLSLYVGQFALFIFRYKARHAFWSYRLNSSNTSVIHFFCFHTYFWINNEHGNISGGLGIGNVILHKISTVSPDISMLALIVWASAISAPPMLILSWFLEGPAQWQTALQTFNVNTMLSLIYLAYFVTLAGYALWGKLLSTGTPGVAASFALLVPLVNLGCSAVCMGESVTVLQIFGSVMVMVGLVINTFGEQLAMLFWELDKEESS